MGDKELASIGVRACVGHGEDTRAVMTKVFVEFVFELVSRAAGSSSLRATGLDHKVGDDTVEGEAVVEAVIGELFEIRDGLGYLVVV